MESLQSPLLLSSKLLPSSVKKPVLEVGFASFFNQRRVIRSVSVKRSVVCSSSKGGGGGSGSQDGFSATLVNSEKKDSSNSAGLRLVPPPSGM